MNTKRRIMAIGCFGLGLLSVSLAMSGCGAATPVQTPTVEAASTITPTTQPTATAAPVPENLADAKDLPVWIDDYVHAYGGKVAVNGGERDANQLLEAVKANPGGFIERKTIKGSETLFFVVNGAPLAIQTDHTWRSILARNIADAKNAKFAMPVKWFEIYNQNWVNAVKNANQLTITMDVDTGVIFEKNSTEDWKNILRDWETVKKQLDSGKIPTGITYDWSKADQIIGFARENKMSLRAQHLVWNGDVQDSIYNGGFTKAELLKILEFTASVKVIKYKGVISEWNAADELVISEFSTNKWGFWSKNVGILDAARLAASTVRKFDPQAVITIADDFELEENFYNQQPGLGVRFLKFVKTLNQEGLIDKADFENNVWVFDMPDPEYMEKYLRQIQGEGIELAAPEIAVFTTKEFPLWNGPRQKLTIVNEPLAAQAEGFKRVVQAYINVGAYDIGLGEVGDETSAFNYSFPGSNPSVFDSQWKPKMGWYEILKIMYDGLLK